MPNERSSSQPPHQQWNNHSSRLETCPQEERLKEMEQEQSEQGRTLVKIEEQIKSSANTIKSLSEKILGNGQPGLLTRIILAEGRSKWVLVLLGAIVAAVVGAFAGQMLIK